ncbi:hypothetical protein C9J85_03865 [Haloferax sp. wsp5]|nr:hypothetical protein C9J85_03865 [Haloferax sp. wsp5]
MSLWRAVRVDDRLYNDWGDCWRDISFDSHTRGIMMWRQLTQWLGGMGIVVLAVAILPELSVGGAQLMDAEAPGPESAETGAEDSQKRVLIWP